MQVQDLKLLHAVLGALRNLSVAPAHRPRLLAQGLLPPCLSLAGVLSVNYARPVVFKLLGTLRLAVEGSPTAAREVAGER